MKKLIFTLVVLFGVCACSSGQSKPNSFNQEQAVKIFNDYVTVSTVDDAVKPHLQDCKFEYRETQASKHKVSAYICNLDLDDMRTFIFVISNTPEFRSEVDPLFRDDTNIVYVAQLSFDKEKKELLGKKELFDTAHKTLVSSKGVQ